MKNGVQVLTKQVPLNASTGTLILADHETEGSPTKMSNIYPTIYQTMKTVPDQIIWDGIHGCYQMFKDCEALESIDMSGFDATSTYISDTKESSYAEMFMNCKSLKTIDLSGTKLGQYTLGGYPWSTEKMFYGCSSLTSVNLESIFTPNGSNFLLPKRASMFENCVNLETITGVIDLYADYQDMFKNCPKLRNVQIKNPPSDFESVSGLSFEQYAVVS